MRGVQKEDIPPEDARVVAANWKKALELDEIFDECIAQDQLRRQSLLHQANRSRTSSSYLPGTHFGHCAPRSTAAGGVGGKGGMLRRSASYCAARAACGHCGGTGRKFFEDCMYCHGVGQIASTPMSSPTPSMAMRAAQLGSPSRTNSRGKSPKHSPMVALLTPSARPSLSPLRSAQEDGSPAELEQQQYNIEVLDLRRELGLEPPSEIASVDSMGCWLGEHAGFILAPPKTRSPRSDSPPPPEDDISEGGLASSTISGCPSSPKTSSHQKHTLKSSWGRCQRGLPGAKPSRKLPAKPPATKDSATASCSRWKRQPRNVTARSEQITLKEKQLLEEVLQSCGFQLEQDPDMPDRDMLRVLRSPRARRTYRRQREASRLLAEGEPTFVGLGGWKCLRCRWPNDAEAETCHCCQHGRWPQENERHVQSFGGSPSSHRSIVLEASPATTCTRPLADTSNEVSESKAGCPLVFEGILRRALAAEVPIHITRVCNGDPEHGSECPSDLQAAVLSCALRGAVPVRTIAASSPDSITESEKLGVHRQDADSARRVLSSRPCSAAQSSCGASVCASAGASGAKTAAPSTQASACASDSSGAEEHSCRFEPYSGSGSVDESSVDEGGNSVNQEKARQESAGASLGEECDDRRAAADSLRTLLASSLPKARQRMSRAEAPFRSRC